MVSNSFGYFRHNVCRGGCRLLVGGGGGSDMAPLDRLVLVIHALKLYILCKALECVDHQNKSIKRCQSKVIFLYESPWQHAACSSDEACLAKTLDV